MRDACMQATRADAVEQHVLEVLTSHNCSYFISVVSGLVTNR